MKKARFLSLLIALVMILSTLSIGMTVTAANAYSDVNEGMWSYGDIMYVSENGLMNGTGGSTFSPAVDVTRAMVVTVLYRMEGSPEVTFDEYAYADVSAGEFYSDAVIWAKEGGIVTSVGVNDDYEDLFAPTRAITRQELATMFVRFASYRHVITDKQADLSSFKDIGDVADWASKAMAWCNAAGLINGTGNGDMLSPKMTATREQFAAIIHRFDVAELQYEYILGTPKPLSKYTEKPQRLVEDADVYVAVDGDDKNPGTFDKPLATFEGAVAKVREIRKSGNVPVVVAFKAGNYGYLDLELTAEDSGCEKCPITYCAYGDGDVVFSNALQVGLDEFVPLEESDKAFFADKVENEIYKVDLSNKSYKGDLTYKKDIYGDYYFGKHNPGYGGFKGTLTFVGSLYDDVESLELARFPNKKAPNGENQFMKVGSAEPTIHVNLNNIFKSRFSKYHTYENIQFIGMDQAEYESSFFVVETYDPEAGKIKTADYTNGRGVHMPPEGYFQNISEELDYDGEYWIDVENKVLYVYNPTSPNYYLATEGTLLKVTDADHINFIGLDFKHSMDEGIIINADNVMISDSEIMGIFGSFTRDTEFGTYAVILNGNNNVLKDSVLTQLGGGGVTISGGDPDFLVPSNSIIDNNLISYFGQTFHGWTPGVRIYDSVGAKVSHNEICYTPHIAIHFDRGYTEQVGNIRAIDNIIEYNYIHDVATYYRDIGAIYIGGCQTNRDNIIRYNLVSRVSAGAWGLYLDDGICGPSVYGNIFHDTGTNGIMGGAGRDNYVCENYIIKTGTTNGQDTTAMSIGAKYSDMLRDEGVDRLWTSTWPGVYEHTINDIPTDPAALKIWQERWPELFEALDERDEITVDRLNDSSLMCNSAGCTYKNNFAFGNSGLNDFSFDESATWFNVIENNVRYTEENDPQIFVNPAIGDYSVKEGSGFPDNRFANIGRY